MPDTKGQSGIEHFEERARVVTETSSNGSFSTYESTPGTGGDGYITRQTRGAPQLDEPEAKPRKSGKKK